MLKEIIINSSGEQTRVAITEDGSLVDFFVDYPENRRMVGDIYLGKVARVLPGIKAAFIDIGMKHDAFLHFSDIGERTKEFQSMLEDEEEDEDFQAQPEQNERYIKDVQTINGVPILKKGEPILIQITKEPVSNKGVRVSSSISIAGRFCVLLPFDNKIGISKKITDFKERRRLRSIARQIIPKNYGLIIRTVAKSQPEESLMEDLKNLKKTWDDIEAKARTEDAPSLIHQDLNTTSSVIRDLFTEDISRVYIDNKKQYRLIKDYISTVHPGLAEKVELYRDKESVFEAFRIDEQINALFSRKVALKNGGYIIIEHTEAMVVIDVNSGKYAASKEQELNSLKTDIEAAREIARQLRLRDIGGLIVIDYIDLEDERNRRKIFEEMRKEFRKDRAKVSILPMSDFGLIQITRQRIRQNIRQVTNDQCPYCAGTGLLTKQSHVLYDIEKWLKKFRENFSERSIIMKCNPNVSLKLKEGYISRLTKLQLKYLCFIKIIEDPLLNMDQFRFFLKDSKKEITDEHFTKE